MNRVKLIFIILYFFFSKEGGEKGKLSWHLLFISEGRMGKRKKSNWLGKIRIISPCSQQLLKFVIVMNNKSNCNLIFKITQMIRGTGDRTQEHALNK